ncbi:uncharacterized protein LOC142319315 isoform X2 [Lycorma delicatula]
MINIYKREVETLKNLGRSWNMSEKEIDKVIEDSIDFFKNQKQKSGTVYLNLFCLQSMWRVLLSSLFLVLVLSSLIIYKKSVQNIIERNVQEIIYPGMKLFRKLMLPVIKTFPSLTEWYDENCLVRNPYFQISDMDCWPCSSVRSVLNLTGSDLSSDQYHSGIPFIYKENQMKFVGFRELQQMYKNNKEMFDQHSRRLEITGSASWKNVEEFLLITPPDTNPTENRDIHASWKLIRLEPTRAARYLFGFPSQIPYNTAGTAPEKFILIDEPRASPYPLPTTEGSTVFVVQGSGSRLFVLDPAPECQSECHRVSLLLQPQHILWYNWWYWRASSFPLLTSEEISITYIGSYY